MNREDIIRMAREAGLCVMFEEGEQEFLKRFAALVAAAELEACAKVFDERDNGIGFYEPHEPAEIIRARINT